MNLTGYMHQGYPGSLAEFGTPVELPHCGAWILVRPIARTPYFDGMGCYPVFACHDWSQLRVDLRELEGRLVSLALVADVFGDYDFADLTKLFDVALHFKDHYVVELSQSPEIFVTPHHRKYARRGLRNVRVEHSERPSDHLDEWIALYNKLIERRNLNGIRAFSRASFAKQFEVPGMVMLRALCGNTAVGAHLWFVQGGVAYSHLSATNDLGYQNRAAYALYWAAIEMFREKFSDSVRWLDLGAGAGIGSDTSNGLSQLKQGWSNGVRPAYFFGRICAPDIYAQLIRSSGRPETTYFPAYRQGEFA